jgi:cytochrome P450
MLAEVDAAFASSALTQPIPTYAKVSQHCSFYIACVKESMRLCPSAPNIFPRLVSADQLLVLDRKVVPVGTEVTCNPWMVHRDKKIYGDDAEIFRPQRWLEDGGDRGRLFDKYNMAFGFGTRSCLGKDPAMMELLKTLLVVCTVI